MSRKPTAQQSACIEALATTNMLKINAAAGSGKTSTLCMMAEAYSEPSLYLAFNKVTATEAAEKFPKHVTCKTTHSIAYAAEGKKMAHKLMRPQGKYVNVAGTGSEIARYFKISPVEHGGDVVLSEAYLGLLVKQTVAVFEQSADEAIIERHTPYGELVEKQKTCTFNIPAVQKTLVKYAKQLWKERIDLRSPVLATHDTYLKVFQLSKPKLNGYKILYLDEAQDTTPCVLDIVLNQAQYMKIVAVGDRRQAIYGWRGAVNAMNRIQCEVRELTKSFRYGQPIADIATAVLERDMVITGFEEIESKAGESVVDRDKPYTRLFRTNAALLAAAIEEIANEVEVSIEVDVKDFVRLLQSAIALKHGEMKSVKHDKVLPYTSWNEMIDEAKFDPEIGRITKVIGSGEADRWINVLEHHVNSRNPLVTFTTSHKSKGREFSQVVIEGDFKSNYGEGGWTGLPEEEQNLLYVACTRAINALEYNQTVMEYLERDTEMYNVDHDIAEEYEAAKQEWFVRELAREERVVMDMIAA